MSYFPLYFPCYAYHRDHPKGHRFETPADFARIDDGAWVDTPAKLTAPEPEPEAGTPALDEADFPDGAPTAPEPEPGPSDDERMQREPEAIEVPDFGADLDSLTKKALIAKFNLGDVPGVHRMNRTEILALIHG
jgi:hypothetical protein